MRIRGDPDVPRDMLTESFRRIVVSPWILNYATLNPQMLHPDPQPPHRCADSQNKRNSDNTHNLHLALHSADGSFSEG